MRNRAFTISFFILISIALFPFTSFSEEKIEMEIASFQGGFGIDFFLECAREFEKLHPNVKINLWGNPRVWEQLLPRFAAGTPPDAAWPGWGMNNWDLIVNNHLLALDPYLEEQAFGSDRKWRDVFIPSLLHKGTYHGKCYIIPFNFNAFGIWYNKKMFLEHGWSAPKTYNELLSLCEKIKKEGIAPLTFTGRYPAYPLRGFVYPWIISAGGYDVFKRIGNLEEGAWNHPACLKALRCVMDMKKRQYFQAGCIGMNHTESQMEFLVGRAAMIPCGTWLHSEMRNLLPPDFAMEFFIPPVFPDGIGDPTALGGPIDAEWVVSTQSKHQREAVDFIKYLACPEKAKKFLLTKGSLMTIRIAGEFDPPEYLKQALNAANQAKIIYNPDFESWYPSLSTEIVNAFSNLYNEVITPEEFIARAEKASKKVREDKNIPKFAME